MTTPRPRPDRRARWRAWWQSRRERSPLWRLAAATALALLALGTAGGLLATH